MSQYLCGNMFLFINLFFTLNSMFLLTLASNDDIDYDNDYRNLQLQLEADKQTRDTYQDPEKFLRHMKSNDFDNKAIRGDGDKMYKGFGDISDNDDSSSNDDSNVYNGDAKITSNNSNDDSDINQEQPLQPQRAVLSMSAPVPIDVQVIKTPLGDIEATHDDMIFMAIVAGCSAAAVLIVAGIGFGWYRLHKKAKAAADVEYPAYGVTGPNKEISPTGDRKLAESAQMYHYQHQKQQIISMSSSRASNEHRGSGSEAESDEENEEGDYTVYECPGLAATGEMEVKNPLFLDDPTPAAINQPTICPASPDREQKS